MAWEHGNVSDNEKGDLAFSSDLSSKFAVSISKQFCLVSKPGLSYLSYKQQQFWAGHLTTVMFFEQWSQLGLNTDVRTNLLIHMLNFVCTLKVPNLGVGCSALGAPGSAVWLWVTGQCHPALRAQRCSLTSLTSTTEMLLF